MTDEVSKQVTQQAATPHQSLASLVTASPQGEALHAHSRIHVGNAGRRGRRPLQRQPHIYSVGADIIRPSTIHSKSGG